MPVGSPPSQTYANWTGQDVAEWLRHGGNTNPQHVLCNVFRENPNVPLSTARLKELASEWAPWLKVKLDEFETLIQKSSKHKRSWGKPMRWAGAYDDDGMKWIQETSVAFWNAQKGPPLQPVWYKPPDLNDPTDTTWTAQPLWYLRGFLPGDWDGHPNGIVVNNERQEQPYYTFIAKFLRYVRDNNDYFKPEPEEDETPHRTPRKKSLMSGRTSRSRHSSIASGRTSSTHGVSSELGDLTIESAKFTFDEFEKTPIRVVNWTMNPQDYNASVDATYVLTNVVTNKIMGKDDPDEPTAPLIPQLNRLRRRCNVPANNVVMYGVDLVNRGWQQMTTDDDLDAFLLRQSAQSGSMLYTQTGTNIFHTFSDSRHKDLVDKALRIAVPCETENSSDLITLPGLQQEQSDDGDISEEEDNIAGPRPRKKKARFDRDKTATRKKGPPAPKRLASPAMLPDPEPPAKSSDVDSSTGTSSNNETEAPLDDPSLNAEASREGGRDVIMIDDDPATMNSTADNYPLFVPFTDLGPDMSRDYIAIKPPSQESSVNWGPGVELPFDPRRSSKPEEAIENATRARNATGKSAVDKPSSSNTAPGDPEAADIDPHMSMDKLVLEQTGHDHISESLWLSACDFWGINPDDPNPSGRVHPPQLRVRNQLERVWTAQLNKLPKVTQAYSVAWIKKRWAEGEVLVIEAGAMGMGKTAVGLLTVLENIKNMSENWQHCKTDDKSSFNGPDPSETHTAPATRELRLHNPAVLTDKKPVVKFGPQMINVPTHLFPDWINEIRRFFVPNHPLVIIDATAKSAKPRAVRKALYGKKHGILHISDTLKFDHPKCPPEKSLRNHFSDKDLAEFKRVGGVPVAKLLEHDPDGHVKPWQWRYIVFTTPTTAATMIKKEGGLGPVSWSYVVVDEAHNAYSASNLNWSALAGLVSNPSFLCLTATPIVLPIHYSKYMQVALDRHLMVWTPDTDRAGETVWTAVRLTSLTASATTPKELDKRNKKLLFVGDDPRLKKSIHKCSGPEGYNMFDYQSKKYQDDHDDDYLAYHRDVPKVRHTAEDDMHDRVPDYTRDYVCKRYFGFQYADAQKASNAVQAIAKKKKDGAVEAQDTGKHADEGTEVENEKDTDKETENETGEGAGAEKDPVAGSQLEVSKSAIDDATQALLSAIRDFTKPFLKSWSSDQWFAPLKGKTGAFCIPQAPHSTFTAKIPLGNAADEALGRVWKWVERAVDRDKTRFFSLMGRMKTLAIFPELILLLEAEWFNRYGAVDEDKCYDPVLNDLPFSDELGGMTIEDAERIEKPVQLSQSLLWSHMRTLHDSAVLSGLRRALEDIHQQSCKHKESREPQGPRKVGIAAIKPYNYFIVATYLKWLQERPLDDECYSKELSNSAEFVMIKSWGVTSSKKAEVKVQYDQFTGNTVKDYRPEPFAMLAVASQIAEGKNLPPANAMILIDADWAPNLITQLGGRVRRDLNTQGNDFTEYFWIEPVSKCCTFSEYLHTWDSSREDLQQAMTSKGGDASGASKGGGADGEHNSAQGKAG